MIRFLFFLFLTVGLCSNAQENSVLDAIQFDQFLVNSLERELVDRETENTFLKVSDAYWRNKKVDYTLHPEKYAKTIALYHANQQKFKDKVQRTKTDNRDRLQGQINRFIENDDTNLFVKNSILFVGSSSIAGWKTSKSFPEFSVINRGIGGMDMHEILYYYEVLIKKYAPSIITIYCDIDIEKGALPLETVALFKELVARIKSDFPKTHILLLSMKPVLVDDFIGEFVRKNKMIVNEQLLHFSHQQKNVYFIDLVSVMLDANGKLKTTIFLEDGMHLNALGYKLWNPIVRNKLIELTR